MVEIATPPIRTRCIMKHKIKNKIAKKYSPITAIIADAELAADGSISARNDVKSNGRVQISKSLLGNNLFNSFTDSEICEIVSLIKSFSSI